MEELEREKEEFKKGWVEKGIDVMICPLISSPTDDQSIDIDDIPDSYARLYSILDFPAGVVPVTRVKSADTSLLSPPLSLQSFEEKGESKEVGNNGEDNKGEFFPVSVQVVSLPHRDECALYIMKLIEDHFPEENQHSKRYREFLFKEWQKVGNYGCLDTSHPAL